MRRLAWFAPPVEGSPATDGTWDRLRDDHTIDHYAARAGDGARSAHDYLWTCRRDPYDLTIFELADHRAYDFVWPYLVRHPGLTHLHDGNLHHARAASLLRQVRPADYRAEFAFDQPAADADGTRLSPIGGLGAAESLWPLRRTVVEASRWLAVPWAWLADELRRDGHDRVSVVPPATAPTGTEPDDALQPEVPTDTVVIVVTGRAVPTRRLHVILRTLERLGPEPALTLVLLGEPADAEDLRSRARCPVVVVPPSRRRAAIARADVCLCPAWPDHSSSRRDWLDCLATGRATVVMDQADLVDVPTLDPHDWRPRATAAPPTGAVLGREPVAVSLDVLDEAHSLRLALTRLIRDDDLRARLARAGQALWSRHFTIEHRADALRSAIARAVATPADPVTTSLPPHLVDDAGALARTTLAALGVAAPDDWLRPAASDPEPPSRR